MGTERRLRYVWTRFRGIARLRAFWHIVVRRYETEVCFDCGCPVGLVWSCPDQALWDRINGGYGGILCIRCFDAACERERIFLAWFPASLDVLEIGHRVEVRKVAVGEADRG